MHSLQTLLLLPLSHTAPPLPVGWLIVETSSPQASLARTLPPSLSLCFPRFRFWRCQKVGRYSRCLAKLYPRMTKDFVEVHCEMRAREAGTPLAVSLQFWSEPNPTAASPLFFLREMSLLGRNELRFTQFSELRRNIYNFTTRSSVGSPLTNMVRLNQLSKYWMCPKRPIRNQI